MIEIRRIRGDSEVALGLVAAMEAYIVARDGPVTPDRTSTVSAAEMCPPAGAFVVVVERGRAVAGGGLRRLSDGVGEVKRMYTVPEARRRGHGRRLLAGIEDAARALGYTRLRLDTGADMVVAQALYRAAGFVEIPDYNGNSYAGYWGEKAL